VALVAVGPVTINHGDPTFATGSGTHGARLLTIGGSCSWAAWHTLDELVTTSVKTTIKGYTGVLEWLAFDDALLAPLTGYYLLSDWRGSADQRASLTTEDAPFTVQAVGNLT
jgi:hypothetical protein